MNAWKELNINDLPSDILVGDYEFEIMRGSELTGTTIFLPLNDVSRPGIIHQLVHDNRIIRYRKCNSEQKHPDKAEMWDSLKKIIQSDLDALANPKNRTSSEVAIRIAGEKIVLNTMLIMEENNGEIVPIAKTTRDAEINKMIR